MPDMEQIYAWTEVSDDGFEGVICALIPLLGVVGNLQHNRRDVVNHFEPIAKAHGEKTGHRVRLVRFERDIVVKEL